MIRFSFSSFIMSLLFANVMIIFLYFLFRNQKRMIKFGLPVLGITTCMIILRMLLPFEITFLSHNIYLPDAVSMAISSFIKPQFLGNRLSLWSLVIIIWLAGSIVSAVRCVVNEYHLSKFIAASSKAFPEDSSVCRVFRKIQEEIPKARRIRLYGLPTLMNPMIYGLRNPYILIPAEHDCDEIQLSYILHHEVAHYLHHDVFLKLCVKIVCIIYWWNPFCKLLMEQAETILEMRIDKTVAKRPDQKLEYLSSLLSIAKQVIETDNSIKNKVSNCFCNKASFVLAIRFHMLTDNKTKPLPKSIKCIVVSLLSALFVLSYTYILEAYYISPQYQADSFQPDINSSYFIKNEDGTYQFYLNGKYQETVDSLEYYDKNIPVYEKEVKTNEN